MVVNREGIEARLEELDEILGELSRYRDVSADEIRGLGGFRNILVHRYQEIDVVQVLEHFQKALTVFRRFTAEVLAWLDESGI